MEVVECDRCPSLSLSRVQSVDFSSSQSSRTVEQSEVSEFPYFGSVLCVGCIWSVRFVCRLKSLLFGKEMVVLSLKCSVLLNNVLI